MVYQIDDAVKRLLYVAEHRTEASLNGFFSMLTAAQKKSILFVCSDMCGAYLSAIRKQLSDAVHVLDRFHIVKLINKALDQVRAAEHRQLKADGYEPVLTNAKWCILKRKENLTEKQALKLKELLQYNLSNSRTARFVR